MIVVADTSVLLNLALVGQVHLLGAMFGQVMIPVAVNDEFERLVATAGRFAGLTLPSWVQVSRVSPTDIGHAALQRLDPGESAAIRLAVHLHADAVLMDESEGRAVAQACGLRTIGILGILMQARQAGYLTALRPVIDDLRSQARFRLSDALVNEVLAACGE